MTTASNSIDHPLLATLKDVERYEQVPYQERFSIQSTYDLIINAAKKFKYKPQISDGKATLVSGVRNIIRFELDKSSKRRG